MMYLFLTKFLFSGQRPLFHVSHFLFLIKTTLLNNLAEKSAEGLTPLSSPSQGGLGFVADKQRVNVALSRARECLVVVGHDKCLEVERIWQSALRGLRKFNGAKDFTNGIEEMLPKNCFAPRSGPMGPERAYDPKAERTSADREFEEDIKVAAAPQTIEQREEDIPDDWDADSD